MNAVVGEKDVKDIDGSALGRELEKEFIIEDVSELITAPCIMCGHKELDLMADSVGNGGVVPKVVCLECGSAFKYGWEHEDTGLLNIMKYAATHYNDFAERVRKSGSRASRFDKATSNAKGRKK